ncbi:MAG TPA: hypothetical protein VEB20_13570 [Azospirillaceae bacterium]|nr:hypothetical protein [Azospirillaceae bacterium]
MPNTIHHRSPHDALDAQADRRAREAAQAGKPAGKAGETDKPEEEGLSFWDFVDVINPLQHIPVVNTLYRELTGDTIKAPAKLAGGALLAGPVGLAIAAAGVVVEQTTGNDVGGHVMAFLKGAGRKEEAPATMVAEAAEPPPPAKPAGKQAAPAPSIPTTVPSMPAMPSVPAAPGPPVSLASTAGDDTAALAALAAAPGGGLPGGRALGGTPPAAEPFALSQTQSDALEALASRTRTSGGVPSDRPKGMGLDRYRALAEAGGGTEPRARSHVPAGFEQAQGAAARPVFRAAPPPTLVHPSTVQSAAEEAVVATLAPPPKAKAAEPARPAGPEDAAKGGQWPPTGPAALPKELIADMMMQAMDKYEAQAKARSAGQAQGLR